MMFPKALSILFLPAVVLGQSFINDNSDGFYRRLYDDGRESILVERFVKGFTKEVVLEMRQNTCSGETEPFSCKMIVPNEGRRIARVWTKHGDFEKIGHLSEHTHTLWSSVFFSSLDRTVGSVGP